MAGGYYTPTTLTAISSAAYREYVRDQVISQFNSAAARDSAISSPQEGMLCYTKDNDVFWYYNGATWVNHERLGRKSHVSLTTAQTGISTTATELTSITLSTTSDRYYRATFTTPLQQSTAAGQAILTITDSTNVVIATWQDTVQLSPSVSYGSVQWIGSTPGGSYTWKAKLAQGSGVSGTVGTASSSTAPSYLLIEDLGTSI